MNRLDSALKAPKALITRGYPTPREGAENDERVSVVSGGVYWFKKINGSWMGMKLKTITDLKNEEATLTVDVDRKVETVGSFTGSDKILTKINGINYHIELDKV